METFEVLQILGSWTNDVYNKFKTYTKQAFYTSKCLTSSLPETDTVKLLPPNIVVTREGRFSCVTLDVERTPAKRVAPSDWKRDINFLTTYKKNKSMASRWLRHNLHIRIAITPNGNQKATVINKSKLFEIRSLHAI